MIVCKKCNVDKQDSCFRMKKDKKGVRRPYYWCKACELVFNNERFKKKRLKNKPPKVEDFEGEVWRDIPNYVGLYQVSNKGRLKSLEREIVYNINGQKQMIWEKVFTPENSNGYHRVTLAKEGRNKRFLLHRLVMLCFKGESNGLQVNHKDGVKVYNVPDNLEYATPKENTHHSIYVLGNKPPIGEKNKNSKLLEIHSPIGDVFYIKGGKEAARRLGLGYSSVNHVLNGRIPLYKGYYFKYLA